MTYEKEFEVFSTNINGASRAFYYHTIINEKAAKNEDMLRALNSAALFWDDYRYFSILSVIIILGRVFDKNKRSHRLKKLIEDARASKHFTKESLRERKLVDSGNHVEWLEGYIQNAHELGSGDFDEMEDFAKEITDLWEKMAKIRKKIFAHQDIMDESRKTTIVQTGKYKAIEQIIQKLLTLEHVLEQASLNGKKPDYTYRDTSNREAAEEEIDDIFSTLINALT